VLAWHVIRGFFGQKKAFQPSFHMPGEILRLV